MSWFKRKSPPKCAASIVKVRNRAILLRSCDGRVECWCPYVCDAANERCEFSAEERR